MGFHGCYLLCVRDTVYELNISKGSTASKLPHDLSDAPLVCDQGESECVKINIFKCSLFGGLTYAFCDILVIFQRKSMKLNLLRKSMKLFCSDLGNIFSKTSFLSGLLQLSER